MARKKSPIRLRCRRLAFGIKACTWACISPLRAARFTHRSDPDRFVIVHPSTKSRDKWQVSFFDGNGPVSDAQASSCGDALLLIPASRYRLREVE